MFTDYVKPELLILIVFLWGIGRALKGSKVDNRLIPFILGVIGIAMAALWIFGTSMPKDGSALLLAIFSVITQGVIVAACAVYGNQLLKQWIEKSTGDASTTIKNKDTEEGK